jgi:pyruvate dehydrogenase E1 component alpha subunit
MSNNESKPISLIRQSRLNPAADSNVLSYIGSSAESTEPPMPEKTLHALYSHMLQLRRLDERMITLQRQGRIGFYGSCYGQEAATIASSMAMNPSDWIFPALRESAAMLHRGFDLVTYLSQIFGNSRDSTKGRQMPSHMADRSVNFVSWSSVIGTQLTQAVGAAWASKIKGDDTQFIAYIGDGGTSAAEFHQALNFAGVYQVPIIFFIQNNHWSISMPTHAQCNANTFTDKAKGYGIDTAVRIDGNDAVAVYATTQTMCEKIRNGSGPVLVEALTYRLGAHSTSDDPSRYRDEREVDAWLKFDPIDRMRDYLIRLDLWDLDQDTTLIKKFDDEIMTALKEAEQIPPPAQETLFEDVYANPTQALREQQAYHSQFEPAQSPHS